MSEFWNLLLKEEKCSNGNYLVIIYLYYILTYVQILLVDFVLLTLFYYNPDYCSCLSQFTITHGN